MDKYLSIEQVGMVFETRKGPFTALDAIDLAIDQGEFVSLIGHSGCGKSTLLNLVAGLTKPTSGAMILAGREIAGPGPDRGVVFQNHSLLPWLTCFDNVYLAVERVFGERETRPELKARASRALELVHLAEAESKFPNEISGGMKQRVGIARALSMEPKMLLLDEPFGALDALTRAHLQDELMRIVAATGSTVLMVTHDVDEAVLLSDRVVMLTNGPAAGIGEVLRIDLPRPRERLSLASHRVTCNTARRYCSFCTRSKCVWRRDMAQAGKVYLIGAGPGDPELLTLKAVRALGEADVVLMDDLVNRAVLAHAPRARVVEVGKRGGCKSTPQAFIQKLMLRLARSGKTVARLKGGDPFVFGRGGEEMLALRKAGIDYEVVSGVTAGIAATAALGFR